ncbi:nucleoside diphosphate phosphatase ENTPD5 isoform X1 [Petromyzon marinus]|uniref:nucleoside diphosphate phosphatase ENTPD5 isoform X1 n=1 Tax=Petromyzon marinus TaxID=7757 RepID=UPI003F727A54
MFPPYVKQVVRTLQMEMKRWRLRPSACALLLGSALLVLLFYVGLWCSASMGLPDAELRLDPSEDGAAAAPGRMFYGIMFDAGSTGTRIHVFIFKQLNKANLPELTSEVFLSVKPGLSAYADHPEQSVQSIEELLAKAKKAIPETQWQETPVVLRATAGLRLLPGRKADVLLEQVRNVFDRSPFKVPKNSVEIMDGANEGISSWITINFLLGFLRGPEDKLFGILDLGGGSTQVTFLPQKQSASDADVTSFKMFNKTFKIYSHSYLGLGLMSARLAILGGDTGEPGGRRLLSPCLPSDYKGEWKQSSVTYLIGGQKGASFSLCAMKVEKMLSGKVEQPGGIHQQHFYAFSYYFDRAVESGLIAPEGGTLKVGDYEDKAKSVCDGKQAIKGADPFLCMDLAYIAGFLQKGLGFSRDTPLQLAKKINNVETAWALGETFHFIDFMR